MENSKRIKMKVTATIEDKQYIYLLDRLFPLAASANDFMVYVVDFLRKQHNLKWNDTVPSFIIEMRDK